MVAYNAKLYVRMIGPSPVDEHRADTCSASNMRTPVFRRPKAHGVIMCPLLQLTEVRMFKSKRTCKIVLLSGLSDPGVFMGWCKMEGAME